VILFKGKTNEKTTFSFSSSYYPEYENYQVSPQLIAERNITKDNLEQFFLYGTGYVSDMSAHKKEEYWQTPEETLNLKTGDCEDKAILQMVLWYTFHQVKGQIALLVTKDEFKYTHCVFFYTNEKRQKITKLSETTDGKIIWTDLETYLRANNYEAYRIFNYSQALHLAFEIKSPIFYN